MQELLDWYCLCLSSVSDWPAVSYQCLSHFGLFRHTRRLVHFQCKLLWFSIRLSRAFWAEWRWTYDFHPGDQGLCNQPFPDDKHALPSKGKHRTLQSQRKVNVRVKHGLRVSGYQETACKFKLCFLSKLKMAEWAGFLTGFSLSVLPATGRLASSKFNLKTAVLLKADTAGDTNMIPWAVPHLLYTSHHLYSFTSSTPTTISVPSSALLLILPTFDFIIFFRNRYWQSSQAIALVVAVKKL